MHLDDIRTFVSVNIICVVRTYVSAISSALPRTLHLFLNISYK